MKIKTLAALITVLTANIESAEVALKRDKAALDIMLRLRDSGISQADFLAYLYQKDDEEVVLREEEPVEEVVLREEEPVEEVVLSEEEPVLSEVPDFIDYGKQRGTRYRRGAIWSFFQMNGNVPVDSSTLRKHLFENQPDDKFWTQLSDLNKYNLEAWMAAQDFLYQPEHKKYAVRQNFLDRAKQAEEGHVVRIEDTPLQKFEAWARRKRRFGLSDGLQAIQDCRIFCGNLRSPSAYNSLHKTMEQVFPNAQIKRVGREGVYVVA